MMYRLAIFHRNQNLDTLEKILTHMFDYICVLKKMKMNTHFRKLNLDTYVCLDLQENENLNTLEKT